MTATPTKSEFGGSFRRRLLLVFATCLATLWCTGVNAASLLRNYELAGNFTDSLGGPALVSGGGSLGVNGYYFDQDTGLSLSGWDPTGQGDNYSIEMFVTIDNATMAVSDYQKIVDVKDRASDNGLYVTDRSLPDYRLEFFGSGLGNGPDTFSPDTFHHLVLSRDSSGGTLSAWLDGQLQWSGAADADSVADAANNIIYFLRDDGFQFHENPAGYVDFINIYDGPVNQSEVDAMVSGLPDYGDLKVTVNKIDGNITIINRFPEVVSMRGYLLTSAAGDLNVTGWTSWDSIGLDGDTWSEANPSANQLAELNLTSSGLIPTGGARNLGKGYGGGIFGAETLAFEYLPSGSAQSIAIPVTYDLNLTFVVGDLNFDSSINSADWLLFIAGSGMDLSGLTMAQAFQMGDMDDDLDNDHDDFVLFKQAYEAANPGSSFDEMVASVPEPASLALAFMAIAVVGLSLWQHRAHRVVALMAATVMLAFVANAASACDDCSTCESMMMLGIDDCSPDAAHGHTHDETTHTHGPPPGSFSASAGPASYYNWDVPVTPAAGTMRFAVLGDTQGMQVLDQLVVDMNNYNNEFFILPGDLVSTGGSGSWDTWIAKTDAFNGDRYMVPGNHDLPVGGDALWQSKFNWLPNSQVVDGQVGIDQMDYYFDMGNSRFVSVTTDSQANGAGGQPAAIDWLDAVLNDPATQAKDHVFVYSHHPVTYQNLSNTGGTAGNWWQTMANSGVVDALFAGHWHLYQPSQPDPNSSMWQATLGTGSGSLEGYPWQYQHGYTLVDVTGPRVEATFFGDTDGDGAYDDIMDQFVIADSTTAPTGLVAYYGFNYGNRNLDTSPAALAKQNHGEYEGDATTVSGGVLGKTLTVDGTGDFAHGGSIGDYNMDILSDLTINLHAKFDALTAGPRENTLVAYSGRIPVIGGGGVYGPQESTNHPYHLSIRDDKRLEVMWEHDDATQVVLTSTVAATVNAGEWHEYMLVRDVANMEVRFYVDGVQLGAAVPFTELPTGGANGFLHIGNGIDGDTGFDGMIDELTIYNDVLSPAGVFVGPVPGDLDGDNDVDLDDWYNNFVPNFNEVLASYGSAATLAMGDLDFDGDVDFVDFDAFSGAYMEANPGADALTFTRVPEPATALLLALGLGLLFTRMPRASRP